MLGTPVKERTERGAGSPPPMLHRVKTKDTALCGKKLSKIVGPIAEAECVVCEELWRGMQR